MFSKPPTPTRSCVSDPSTATQLSKEDPTSSNDQPSRDVESTAITSHSTLRHVIIDLVGQQDPTVTKGAAASHPAVHNTSSDHTVLTQALHNNGPNVEFSNTNKILEGIPSHHGPRRSTLMPTSLTVEHTTIGRYPYPTFICQEDLDQGTTQLQVASIVLTDVEDIPQVDMLIGIGAQFSD